MNILGRTLHLMVQVLFPNNDAIFQDNDLPIHTTRSVQSLFEEHEDAFQHLLLPAQWPTLNIIEPLWSLLESMERSRFHPPSLKQIEEEQYNMPLHTVRNLQESIPRRIQPVLLANGGPTPH